MNIFIVCEIVDYEGSEIKSVFATESSAQQYINNKVYDLLYVCWYKWEDSVRMQYQSWIEFYAKNGYPDPIALATAKIAIDPLHQWNTNSKDLSGSFQIVEMPVF